MNGGEALVTGNYAAAGLHVLGAAMDMLGALRACFAAGTPVQAEFGPKAIEQLVEGERVWTRSDDDPDGEPVLRRIERVFVHHAMLIQVRVGNITIGTTAEHPLWVVNKGWVDAHLLMPGDRFVGQNGEESVVRDVVNTGNWTTVYNISVAEHHTCFIGCPDWGFDVWVHNYKSSTSGNNAEAIAGKAKHKHFSILMDRKGHIPASGLINGKFIDRAKFTKTGDIVYELKPKNAKAIAKEKTGERSCDTNANRTWWHLEGYRACVLKN